MKLILSIGALVLIVAGAFVFWDPSPRTATSNVSENTEGNTRGSVEARSLSSGTYEVDTERSTLHWAGQKPLIDGYVNSGSIALQSGTIIADDNNRSGEFIMDMNTLSVSETPTKPGSESTLEEHLKSERWFNVEAYPTATFSINEITPREDTGETFIYDVTGELTMKGQTGTLTFPAKIYLDESDDLHALADFEFDRTEWGITSGSGSFFDNLADNVIDDMVMLSFHLVAEQQ